MPEFWVEKDWVAHGFRCIAVARDMGYRNGYVGVPKEHPLFGVNYSDSSPRIKKLWKKMKNEPIGKRGIIPLFCHTGGIKEAPSLDILFNVHGSLTYSGSSSRGYPISTQENLWWFGFDCRHAGDAQDPSIVSERYASLHEALSSLSYGEIRTTAYVVAECESLAEQLAVMYKPKPKPSGPPEKKPVRRLMLDEPSPKRGKTGSSKSSPKPRRIMLD